MNASNKGWNTVCHVHNLNYRQRGTIFKRCLTIYFIMSFIVRELIPSFGVETFYAMYFLFCKNYFLIFILKNLRKTIIVLLIILEIMIFLSRGRRFGHVQIMFNIVLFSSTKRSAPWLPKLGWGDFSLFLAGCS